MQTIKLPENVTGSRNTDRYTKCASCNASAAFRFASTTATITTTTPGFEPTSEWVNGRQVFVDRVEVKAVAATACVRHAELNIRRVAEATSRSFVVIFDGNTPIRTEV